ncbi:MAG: response regulator, partial [Kangiellaceae bacterium]|jgi:CheY-like chemotaxis protein|nr:response regulator [Kangiellaceae bacterium]
LNRGVDIFIAKPYHQEELKTIVRSFVRKSSLLMDYYSTNSSASEESKAANKPAKAKSKDKLDVLYIEDNKVLQILMRNFVSSLTKVDLSLCLEGQEGIDYAERHIPDLILLDLNLPDMDGWQIAEHLRNNQSTKDIRIVAVSGEIMNDEKQQRADTLFDGMIHKPFNQEQIHNVFKNK